MNPQTFLLVIRAHWRTVLIWTVLGLIAGVAAAAIKATSYKATAEVVATVHTPDAADPTQQLALLQPQMAPDYLATQIDIIKSARVAQHVAQLLKMDQDPQMLAEFRDSGQGGDAVTYFGVQLAKHLKVEPSVNSRLIAIQYTGGDPESAATIANAFAKSYQDISLELETAPARQSDEWFQRNIDGVRQRLREAQAKLAQKQSELGVTAPLSTVAGVVGPIDAEETRLAGLSQSLALAQAAQANAASHTGGGALPDAMLNPVVQALDVDLHRLEAQRDQLATHVGPNGQDIKEIDHQIAELKRQRDAQASTVARSASASASQASASVRQIEAQMAQEKVRVIRSDEQRGQLAALQQDVDGLRKSYDELVEQHSRAMLIGSGEHTNVAILSAASPPAESKLLVSILLTVGGLLVGCLVGIGAAIVGEFLDQKLRTSADAETWLGIANLGTVHILPESRQRRLPAPRRLIANLRGS